MRNTAFRGVVCALACAVTLGLIGTGTAAPATPDGYQRVPVEGLPLSIALPDDWSTRSLPRSGAKKVLKENPDLVEQGLTVEKLLAQPLTSGVDIDGDGYSDRYLTVQLGDSSGMPSPEELKAGLTTVAGVRDITVKRSTVAKKPALVVTYAQDANRDDGAPFTVFSTTYMFVPRGTDSVMLQFYRTSESDDEFRAIVDTMIKSVKVQ
jgi:hypothetical protein